VKSINEKLHHVLFSCIAAEKMVELNQTCPKSGKRPKIFLGICGIELYIYCIHISQM
jgi:hypothetical protein